MKVTLMLADYARVADGKLDVIGGGWSQIAPEGAFGFFVATLIQCPWDQTNRKHTFRLDLLDADGNAIPAADGEHPVHAAGEFEAGRPAGITPGIPLDLPLVLPFGPLVLDPGRYELRLTINGETQDDWYLAFTVRSLAD